MGSMDGDETVDALETSINESMAEVTRLNNELIGLESYRTKIMAEGMSKSIGFGLEHIAPGTLGNLNLNMLTETPTVTKMNVALESIDWKSRITKVAIVILVVGIILKMLDWLLSPTGNRVSGSNGDAAAKAIHEAKEKLRDEVKKTSADIHARPTQNVVRGVAEKDEAWMLPVYRVLEEMLDKRRVTDKEALRCIEIMRLYRTVDLTGAGDREVNLPLLFIFLLKSGMSLNLSNFGFYLGYEPGLEIVNELPAPFRKKIFEYNNLRNNLGYALLTISRIIKQGTDAGREVEVAYKASGDKSSFNGYVNDIAREVTMYNDELKNAFDYVFGNAQDNYPYVFSTDGAGVRWVSQDSAVRRYDKVSDDYKSYIGQPAGTKYNHSLYVLGAGARNTNTYEMYGSGAEHMWWGDNFRKIADFGAIDIRGKEGEKNLKIHIDEELDISNWMLRTLCSENEIKLAIIESNSRMMALRDEFMGSGNKETERLKNLCEELLSELKVIEKRARESVPTVWHVPWKNNTGLHYSDISVSTGRDNAVIESTFGEVCMHLLNGTKAQINCFISTKATYQKIEKSYLAFRDAIEKFRL